jgi:hypothetical protein
MISLSFLFWSTLAIAFIAFWWQSDQIKSFAISHIVKYCSAKKFTTFRPDHGFKGALAGAIR